MRYRFSGAAIVIGILVAVALLSPGLVAAQAQKAAVNTAPPKTWTAPRTPDGQPDLQGYWTNATYTPLQRPSGITKEFFTPEELEAVMKQAATDDAEQTVPGTVQDVHYDFTQFGLDPSQGVLAVNLRTSMIVDPPDGRLPLLSAEGQKRAAEHAEARKRMGGAFDAVQNQSLQVRCVHIDRVGPPMLPGRYNNTYEIVQAAGQVMLLVEMLHDVRVIPLGGRPPLSSNIRQWTGSPRGRWEGETLVVESSNFTDRTGYIYGVRDSAVQGGSEKERLTERFTRVDENTIRYQFTVDDPATWTRPWTAELFMKKTVGPIFEHACHEGNYALANTLAGARAEEKRGAEAAKAVK